MIWAKCIQEFIQLLFFWLNSFQFQYLTPFGAHPLNDFEHLTCYLIWSHTNKFVYLSVQHVPYEFRVWNVSIVDGIHCWAASSIHGSSVMHNIRIPIIRSLIIHWNQWTVDISICFVKCNQNRVVNRSTSTKVFSTL